MRYMFRLELDVQDLADTRFAISPVHEVIGSLWPVYARQARPEHRGWAARVRAQPGLDHEFLAALVSPSGPIPDFLAPPPASPRPRLADQLAQIRRAAADTVVTDVLAAYGRAPLPACLRGLADDPAGLRDRAALALGRYWDVALAPHWPRIRAVLEADLLHRGHQLAAGGPRVAIGGLDRRVRWRDGVIDVDIVRQWRREAPVAGRRLQLLPSVFTPFPHLPVDMSAPPVLGYPARATAGLWQPPAPVSPAAVQALLGGARARLLAMLAKPSSTTELAARLGVTPSAVSQQLRVLAAAGLVTSVRVGRVVQYRQTILGARLSGGAPAG
jgi:DNA-binding transcriptional ArsR family regulator